MLSLLFAINSIEDATFQRRDEAIPDVLRTQCATYAILSHTWASDEDEVTLQEMQTVIHWWDNGTDPSAPAHLITKKAGFQKIIACCRQAVTHGPEYVWIDTCCSLLHLGMSLLLIVLYNRRGYLPPKTIGPQVSLTR